MDKVREERERAENNERKIQWNREEGRQRERERERENAHERERETKCIHTDIKSTRAHTHAHVMHIYRKS